MQNFRTFPSAVSFYKQATALPVKAPIRDQLHRAALLICTNLAEGRGKPTRRDQLRYFHIAFGSLRECQALLLIAGYKDGGEWQQLDAVGAQLHRLIQRAS